MCKDCGCGGDEHVHSHKGVMHSHKHDHDHTHEHAAAGAVATRTVTLEQKILSRNDEQAEKNRAWLKERGVVAVNLISSPGSLAAGDCGEWRKDSVYRKYRQPCLSGRI